MLFNSYGFIFCFLPLTLLGYYLCKRIGERCLEKKSVDCLLAGFLVLISLVFYGWSDPGCLPVLLVSMAVNYILGLQIEKAAAAKPLLAVGVLLDLGVLLLFKYADGGSRMPMGLSFYTFTQIAFLMECYRGSLKQVKLLEYSLYVAFFPKLLQGPIALPDEILPQMSKLGKKLDWERIYRSLALFIFGLFKKVILADTLGAAADYGYANLAALNSADALIVMLSYTLQLYFDFSGYCDMAMGIAGLFGIELPVNFDSPYKAANILEFWKGWHRTLTRFFTKYLYIPLGGNRRGRARTYLNCLIVFFFSGLWHGSGITFLIWGMLHGVLYVLTRMWQEAGGRSAPEVMPTVGRRSPAKAIRHGIAVILTFLFVNVAWVFFRAPSVSEALTLLQTIISGGGGRLNWELAGCFNLDEFWYVIKVFGIDAWQYSHYILMFLLLAVLLIMVFFAKNSVYAAKRLKPGIVQTAFLALLFVWSVLSVAGVSTFLYVNF